MMRILPVAIVAALIVAGVVLSFSVGAGGGSETQRSAALAYPDVWEALETAPSVEVYIGVVPPGGSAQLNILAALGPEDFQLTYAFERYGLSGRVTKSGLRILANHPDVRGVEIPVLGTWNIGPTAVDNVVEPAVGEVLEEGPQADVIVSLRPLDLPLAGNPDMMAAYAAKVQGNLLSILTPEDFTLKAQFKFAPVLAGTITRPGLEKLSIHPDVVGVALEEQYSAGRGEVIIEFQNTPGATQ